MPSMGKHRADDGRWGSGGDEWFTGGQNRIPAPLVLKSSGRQIFFFFLTKKQMSGSDNVMFKCFGSIFYISL